MALGYRPWKKPGEAWGRWHYHEPTVWWRVQLVVMCRMDGWGGCRGKEMKLAGTEQKVE